MSDEEKLKSVNNKLLLMIVFTTIWGISVCGFIITTMIENQKRHEKFLSDLETPHFSDDEFWNGSI